MKMTLIRCLKFCILESLLAATDVLTSESLRTTEENDAERSEEPAVCGGIQSRITRPPAPTFWNVSACRMCQLHLARQLISMSCCSLQINNRLLFLLKKRESAESVRWLIALSTLIKRERSAALKARRRYEPWKQVTSKWRGLRGMTGTVTPLKAEVRLFNNAFLNAEFSTLYCGLLYLRTAGWSLHSLKNWSTHPAK